MQYFWLKEINMILPCTFWQVWVFLQQLFKNRVKYCFPIKYPSAGNFIESTVSHITLKQSLTFFIIPDSSVYKWNQGSRKSQQVLCVLDLWVKANKASQNKVHELTKEKKKSSKTKKENRYFGKPVMTWGNIESVYPVVTVDLFSEMWKSYIIKQCYPWVVMWCSASF